MSEIIKKAGQVWPALIESKVIKTFWCSLQISGLHQSHCHV